ncbi:MAG: DEAD/DEAH box helicase, partial [Candidatus Colwellbacteria bacterium]|nr:DEAD/DEAH box helicase [Candidatus Colwellbacteria bacterium]
MGNFMDLSLAVEKLKNVGTRNAPRLRRLGIKNVRDLLWHFPSKYEDYSKTAAISDIAPDQKVNVQGEVVKITTRKLFPRRMFITDAIVRDLSGAVRVIWFNQPFIENQLPEGAFVSLAGKVKTGKSGIYIASPTYEKMGGTSYGPEPSPVLKHTKGLVPVYPETDGITSKYLRFLIQPLLANLQLKDPIPEIILKKYDFPRLVEAIQSVHFPDSESNAKIAKERLAFDDLMLFQIKALLERRRANQLKSISIAFDESLVKGFISELPFELTKDQKIAALEILKDLERRYPMNRLLEGDVGSGKTVVALIAAYQIAKQDCQTVFMAPTEVLAQQHYKTLTSIIKDGAVNTALLVGSEARFNNQVFDKKLLKKKIASGEVNILIGTHAVIQKGVTFSKLAMVVIDEQHRFGISQRATLVKNKNLVPHLLSMTATPIPRTLALTIYGDLDISLIKEKP